MNLKDRLIISNQNNAKMQNNNGEYIYTTDEIFSNCKEAGTLIREFILNKRNIVFVHTRDFDSNLFINYIQILMRDKQLNLLSNFDESKLQNNGINLIKNPNVNNIVKIFEYIIYGYKPFIFNLCLDSSDNIINKLSTVISVNYANLNDNNIKTLIYSSDSIFVIVDKKDNSFVISSVFEFKNNSQSKINKLYTNDGNEISNYESKQNEKVESNDIDDDLINYDIDSHINGGESEEEIEEVENTKVPAKKMNKCQLLREKVRKKRKNNI